MMDAATIARSAETLGAARLNHVRLTDVPPEYLPDTEADAYAVLDALVEWFAGHGGGEIGGYKVALVSAGMRADLSGGSAGLGVDSPIYGTILKQEIYHEVANLPYPEKTTQWVEGEFGVRIGRDVPSDQAPFTRASIAPYVSHCMAGMEIAEWTINYLDYDKPLGPIGIADNGSNAAGVFGPMVEDWQDLDLAALNCVMTIDGKEVASGKGSDLDGHPLEVLAWLAGKTADQGKQLREGQLILLGSVTPSIGSGTIGPFFNDAAYQRGSEVIVHWDSLGDVKAILA